MRARREDVRALTEYFLRELATAYNRPPLCPSAENMAFLERYDWPGNVRELENVISRGVLRAARGVTGRGRAILVEIEHLDLGAPQPVTSDVSGANPARAGNSSRPLGERVDGFRRRAIVEAVERHGGNWAAAARELGIHRSNLHQLATRLGLRAGSARSNPARHR